jgi:DNA-binding transcriptional ArsR family regulator
MMRSYNSPSNQCTILPTGYLFSPMHVAIPDALLERAAEKFRMLGDPTRLSILRALLAGEKNVGAVVAETGQNQANVSKHLKLLADSGMVGRRKEGLQVFYSIGDPLIERLCDLVCRTIVEEARAAVDHNRKILKNWQERG